MGIILKNLSFAYQKSKQTLNNISLKIKEGTFFGILGLNGSGKTTLTYLLNGLIPQEIKGYLSGDVLIDGISTKTKGVSFFAQKVGMVFQNPDFSLFNLTVSEEIEFGLKNFKLENRNERVVKALKSVGLNDFENRDPQTLSLGEKQKVALACILALETKYLVLDEPTAQLDYKSSLELYKILDNLRKMGKTIIVVEHDTDYLWQYAKEVLILRKGQKVALGPAKKILSDEKLLHKLELKIPNTK